MVSLVFLTNKNNGTVYAYINQKIYDESKKKYVYKRRCVGHVDPKSGKILPNRAKKDSHKMSVESVGIDLLFSGLASDTGLTHALQIAFSRSWRLILTCAMYCATQDGPLSDLPLWSSKNANQFGSTVHMEDLEELISSMESRSIESFMLIWNRKVGDTDAVMLPIKSVDNYLRRPSEMKFGIRLSNDSFASDYEVCFGKNTRLPLGFVDHATPPSSLQDIFSGNTGFTWLDMDSYTFMIPPYVITDSNLTELASSKWNFMAELPNTLTFTKEAVKKHHQNVFSSHLQDTTGRSDRVYTTIDLDLEGRTVYQHIYYDALLEESESSAFMNLIDKCTKELESGNIIVPHNSIYSQYFVAKTDDDGKAYIDLNPDRIMSSMEGAGFKMILSDSEKDPMEVSRWSDIRNDVALFFDNLRNSTDNSNLKLYLAPNGVKRDFIQFLALILRAALRHRMDETGLSRTYSVKDVLNEMSSVCMIRSDNRKNAVMSELNDDQKLMFDVLGITS